MSAVTQSNIVSPMVEEAYRLLGKLNESQLIVIVNSIKNLLKKIEQARTRRKKSEGKRRLLPNCWNCARNLRQRNRNLMKKNVLKQ